MKKQTKVLVTLSAAALLAVGASAVSFAEGWDNSTGVWQYLDKDGEAVTDEWKSSNGQWFWLDDEGVMATDSVIEDDSESKAKYYYVDANGARVTNTWKAVAKDDDDDDSDAEYYWMYFGSDGKAYTTSEDDDLTKSKLKTINGLKYAFDSKGHMLYGWISKSDKTQHDSEDDFWRNDDVAYYANGWNDGHIQTGWKQLDVMNAEDEEKTYWFYFGNDGVKQKNKQKKINGVKYSFAADGHMLDEWVSKTNSDAKDGTAGQLSYFNGDGAQRKNKWIYAVPAEDYILKNDVAGTGDVVNDDYNDDENRWFYVNASGKVVAGQIKKINGKKYAFDKFGRMKKNFVFASDNVYKGNVKNDKVTREDFLDVAASAADSDNELDGKAGVYDLYYMSDDEKNDGSLKKGYQTITLDDDTYQFYFNTSSGKAENGYIDKIKKFVAYGLVVKPADADANYVGVVADVDGTSIKKNGFGTAYNQKVVLNGSEIKDAIKAGSYVVLVNKQGTVVKNKSKLKDENDHYYIVNKNGFVLAYFDSEDDYDDFVKALKGQTTDSSKSNYYTGRTYRNYASNGKVTVGELAGSSELNLADAYQDSL
jgi:glucan-binding YG repeat protein